MKKTIALFSLLIILTTVCFGTSSPSSTTLRVTGFKDAPTVNSFELRLVRNDKHEAEIGTFIDNGASYDITPVVYNFVSDGATIDRFNYVNHVLFYYKAIGNETGTYTIGIHFTPFKLQQENSDGTWVDSTPLEMLDANYGLYYETVAFKAGGEEIKDANGQTVAGITLDSKVDNIRTDKSVTEPNANLSVTWSVSGNGTYSWLSEGTVFMSIDSTELNNNTKNGKWLTTCTVEVTKQ